MLARRNALKQLEYGEHGGLAFQKLYRQHDEKGESAKELLQAIAKLKVSSQAYKTAFARWQSHLPEQKLLLTATTKSALAIGLGNTSPIEVGFSLHQTYGTPFLPGSAIKGLLIRAADAHDLRQEVKDILFGTTESATHIVYWDGWLEPSSTPPFQQDVITVHHQKYYGSSGKEGYPTDFDDPNPVAFLSVRPKTTFCLAISSNSKGSEPWLWLVVELLQYALEKLGLGGKTNSGYGYFDVKLPEKPKSKHQLEEALFEKHQKRIEAINGRNMFTEAPQLLGLLQNEPAAIRKMTLTTLLEKLDKFQAKKENFYKRAKSMLEES